MRKKPYCICRKRTTNKMAASILNFLPDAKWGGKIGVHNVCRRPFEAYWRAYIHPCMKCMKRFSNPYEYRCKDCFEGDVYRSWAWVARQVPPWEIRKIGPKKVVAPASIIQ